MDAPKSTAVEPEAFKGTGNVPRLISSAPLSGKSGSLIVADGVRDCWRGAFDETGVAATVGDICVKSGTVGVLAIGDGAATAGNDFAVSVVSSCTGFRKGALSVGFGFTTGRKGFRREGRCWERMLEEEIRGDDKLLIEDIIRWAASLEVRGSGILVDAVWGRKDKLTFWLPPKPAPSREREDECGNSGFLIQGDVETPLGRRPSLCTP